MTRIKICGITHPEDAIAAVKAGAHAIGMVFYDQAPRGINIKQAQEIVSVLPPFVSTIGLFVNPSVAYVEEVLSLVPLSCLQFHGGESEVFCQRFGVPYVKAIRVQSADQVIAQMDEYSSCQAVVLDAYVPDQAGGTGHQFDWTLVPVSRAKPIVLAGGLNPDNVSEAIGQVAPYAVDVSSGVESSLGQKDHDKVLAFCKAVSETDATG